MQRINCYVRLHFLHSYTGLIFRLNPCFWGKQCIDMPLSFFKWQGCRSLLVSPRRTSDPSSPTHGSWGKSLKWKNRPVWSWGACVWCGETQKVQGRPWHPRGSSAEEQTMVPGWGGDQADNDIKGSSRVDLMLRSEALASMFNFYSSSLSPWLPSWIHLKWAYFYHLHGFPPAARVAVAENNANYSNNNSCHLLAIC